MLRAPRIVIGAIVIGGLSNASTACWTPIAKDVPASPEDGGTSVDGGDSNQTDFYVDPSGSPPTFNTITDAAHAASLSRAPTRTIHVAEGTYGIDTGETLPIELRGVSLIGATTGLTVIVGTGALDISRPSVASEEDVVAALLVGDRSIPATIAHLIIVSTATGTSLRPGTEAIVCDRGTVTGPGMAPANVTFDDVAISGFDMGLRIAASRVGGASSGCSALIRASKIQNGSFGVFAEGETTDEKPSQFVAIQVGDGSNGGGNTFNNLHVKTKTRDSFFNGGAISTRAAVTGITAIGNSIYDCDVGMWPWDKIGGDTSDGAVIIGNDFGSLNNAGLVLAEHVVVSRLESNTFHNISTGDVPEINWSGVGLVLDDWNTAAFPAIRHARGNTFFANDVGVAFRVSQSARLTSANSSDFGTANDLGGNTFQCNGLGPRTYAKNGGAPGGDVLINVYFPSQATLSFEGNTWDHATPAIAPPAESQSGIDIFTGGRLAVDTANAKIRASPACPDGQPIGPAPASK